MDHTVCSTTLFSLETKQLNVLYKNNKKGVVPSLNLLHAYLRLTVQAGSLLQISFSASPLRTCWWCQHRHHNPVSSIKYYIREEELSLKFCTFPLLCANSPSLQLEAVVCLLPSSSSATTPTSLGVERGSQCSPMRMCHPGPSLTRSQTIILEETF